MADEPRRQQPAPKKPEQRKKPPPAKSPRRRKPRRAKKPAAKKRAGEESAEPTQRSRAAKKPAAKEARPAARRSRPKKARGQEPKAQGAPTRAGRQGQRPLRADRAAQGAPDRRPGPRPADRKARALLRFSPRGAAQDIAKLIDSAAANAENNHDLVADEMRVAEITVDEGPTLRRYRPRALGRATRINKRTSHITVALTPEELS